LCFRGTLNESFPLQYLEVWANISRDLEDMIQNTNQRASSAPPPGGVRSITSGQKTSQCSTLSSRSTNNHLQAVGPIPRDAQSGNTKDRAKGESNDCAPLPPLRDHSSGFCGNHVQTDLQSAINVTGDSCFACDACTQTKEERRKNQGCSLM